MTADEFANFFRDDLAATAELAKKANIQTLD